MFSSIGVDLLSVFTSLFIVFLFVVVMPLESFPVGSLFVEITEMGCLFKRSSVNKTKDEDFKKAMQNWNPPKVPVDQIYGRDIQFNFPFLESIGNCIKTRGRTVIIQGEYLDLQLNGRNSIQRFWYNYLFVGLVQVAIKPLTRNGLNNSVLVCLRDGRCRSFIGSQLAVAEFSLNNGPVYFNYYPRNNVPVKEAHDSLTLSLKVDGFNSEHHGSRDMAVVYKVYYKLLDGMVLPLDRKSLSKGNTTFIETNLVSNKVPVERTTAWDSVEFPERWTAR